MRDHRIGVSVFLTAAMLAIFAAEGLAETQKGEWTLSHADAPGKARFSMQGSRGDGDHFSNSSDWNVSEFQGLDLSTRGKHDVHFTIARDAGNIECEGFLKDGEGAGLFTFTPNAEYSRQMGALGFTGVSDERQIAFALHNVSLAFARDMKTAGIEGLDTDKLLAFRIHGVDIDFVNSLRVVGLNVRDADKLIAFRIHSVSPEYVKELGRLGYQRPEPDQLIALRIHGVTPEFIEKMRSHGMQNLTLEQLVNLRIHGID